MQKDTQVPYSTQKIKDKNETSIGGTELGWRDRGECKVKEQSGL